MRLIVLLLFYSHAWGAHQAIRAFHPPYEPVFEAAHIPHVEAIKEFARYVTNFDIDSWKMSLGMALQLNPYNETHRKIAAPLIAHLPVGFEDNFKKAYSDNEVPVILPALSVIRQAQRDSRDMVLASIRTQIQTIIDSHLAGDIDFDGLEASYRTVNIYGLYGGDVEKEVDHFRKYFDRARHERLMYLSSQMVNDMALDSYERRLARPGAIVPTPNLHHLIGDHQYPVFRDHVRSVDSFDTVSPLGVGLISHAVMSYDPTKHRWTDTAKIILYMHFAGISVDQQDASGMTAVHHALIRVLPEITEVLLKLNPNLTIKTYEAPPYSGISAAQIVYGLRYELYPDLRTIAKRIRLKKNDSPDLAHISAMLKVLRKYWNYSPS
jgi:hypothetical protein